MNKGDIVRRKDDHSVTKRVNGVRRKYVPGYGFNSQIEIFNGFGMEWVAANRWEVIKGDRDGT
jgi:hypothetical protein